MWLAARAGKHGGLSVSSRVVNLMRIFLRVEGGRERDFSFENSTVGVREGHQVTVVRAGGGRLGQTAIIVALANRTTGQREEIAGAFQRACAQLWIGARWRAIAFAGGLGLIYWAISAIGQFEISGFWWSLAIAVLSWPLFWGLGVITDALVLPARRRAAEARLRGEIEARLNAPPADQAAGSNSP